MEMLNFEPQLRDRDDMKENMLANIAGMARAIECTASIWFKRYIAAAYPRAARRYMREAKARAQWQRVCHAAEVLVMMKVARAQAPIGS